MFRSIAPFLVAAAVCFGACAASGTTREAVTAEAVRELHARSLSAESCFVAAVAAEERQDLETAARLYHRVGVLVPGYEHAMRREGNLRIAMGQRASGLALIQTAAARRRTAENLYA